MGYYADLIKAKQKPEALQITGTGYYAELLREKYNYDEKQPRDEKGRWTIVGGADGAKAEETEEETKETAKPDEQKETSSHIPLAEFLGEEFKGYKGQDAVNKLLKEKRGHIKAAFYREDIGEITLAWGDEEQGLCHLIKSREEKNPYKVDLILDNLTEAIEKGVIRKGKSGKFEIWHNKIMAIVRPDYYGDDIRFVVTGFKQRCPNKN